MRGWVLTYDILQGVYCMWPDVGLKNSQTTMTECVSQRLQIAQLVLLLMIKRMTANIRVRQTTRRRNI